MARHLLLRLEAPLMAFGGEAIDNHGVVREFPATSMLVGLLANALGWHRRDAGRLRRLQTRLVHASRLERWHPELVLRDFQTAKLQKSDQGWTTRGAPEGRDGGANTYSAPHLRYRDYHVDALVCLALRLEPEDEIPDLEDLARALEMPVRPLFIGRKPCLPSAPLAAGFVDAANVLDALKHQPALAPERAGATVPVFWPDGEGEMLPSLSLSVTDERNWQSGVHGGTRIFRRGRFRLPAREVAS